MTNQITLTLKAFDFNGKVEDAVLVGGNIISKSAFEENPHILEVIGTNCIVGPGCRISPSAYIKDGVSLGTDVFVKDLVFIGRGVVVGDFARLGQRAWVQAGAKVARGEILSKGETLYAKAKE